MSPAARAGAAVAGGATAPAGLESATRAGKVATVMATASTDFTDGLRALLNPMAPSSSSDMRCALGQHKIGHLGTDRFICCTRVSEFSPAVIAEVATRHLAATHRHQTVINQSESVKSRAVRTP